MYYIHVGISNSEHTVYIYTVLFSYIIYINRNKCFVFYIYMFKYTNILEIQGEKMNVCVSQYNQPGN